MTIRTCCCIPSKELKNLQKKEEQGKAREWLRRLQRFVTNPANADYFQEGGKCKSGAGLTGATEYNVAADAAPPTEAQP